MDFIYIFLHIPKCAGSTLIRDINKSLKPEEYLGLYFTPDGFKEKGDILRHLASISEEDKNKIKFIYGHNVFYGIHHFFKKKCRYVTFLRNPISRLVSHYNYCRTDYDNNSKRGHTPKVVDENQNIIDFDTFVEKNEILSNFITKFLVNNFDGYYLNKPLSIKDLNRAKEILSRFYFVGDTDFFDNQVKFLYYHFKATIGDYRENVSTIYYSIKSEDKRKELESKNKIDIELFSHYTSAK